MSAPDARFYWCRHTDGRGRWTSRAGRREPEGPPGADLAALRRGLGREPGSVPQMWPFYTRTTADGALTAALQAEHAALTLFGLHQQSQTRPMHRDGVGLGTAALALRRHGDGPPDGSDAAAPIDWNRTAPTDRRFTAAATATGLTELVLHLRGLVTHLRGIGQPLDYTQLFHQLRTWQDPAQVAQVRRRWGLQYFTRTASPSEPTPAEETL